MDPVALVQNELDGDVPRKIAVLFNLAIGAPNCNINEGLAMCDQLNSEAIYKAARRATAERFVVSFYRQNSIRSKGVATLRREHPPYVINAQFQSLNDPCIRRLCEAASGAQNGFMTLEEKDGICLHVGEGAGPAPTVAAMIEDARRLLAARTQ